MNSPRWLILAILATPLAVTSVGQSGNIAQAKNNVFIHLALAGVLWLVSSWWLRAVLLWTWATFVISGMHGWAFIGLLGVVAWCLFYQGAMDLTEAEWRNVQRAITLAAIFQVAWMGVQRMGWDGVFVAIAAPGTGHAAPDPSLPVPAQGWFNNPMDAALFLAMSLPALLAVHWSLAVVAGLALLSLKSTAGVAAAGLLVALMGTMPAWRWLRTACGSRTFTLAVTMLAIAFAGLGAWAYVSVVDPQGFGYRPLIWTTAWQVTAHHPWAGWGVNAIDHRLIFDSPIGRWNFLFSDWLQWRLEAGRIGLALVGGYVLWLAHRVWRERPRMALVAPAVMLLALSTASIPFRIGPVALLAACYLGRLHAEVTAP